MEKNKSRWLKAQFQQAQTPGLEKTRSILELADEISDETANYWLRPLSDETQVAWFGRTTIWLLWEIWSVCLCGSGKRKSSHFPFLQLHVDNCSDELNRQHRSYGYGEEIRG